MKNENKIDNYFELVKKNPPLMNIEKVHRLIAEVEAEVEAKVEVEVKAEVKAEVKKGRRKLLKFTIMTTIFAVIISAFLFWTNLKNENPNDNIQILSNSVQIVNSVSTI